DSRGPPGAAPRPFAARIPRVSPGCTCALCAWKISARPRQTGACPPRAGGSWQGTAEGPPMGPSGMGRGHGVPHGSLTSSRARQGPNTLQGVREARQAGPVPPASAEQYRATFEQAAVGIVHSSLEGELQLVNRAFCLMTGYPRAELARLHIRDLTHPADLESSMEGRRKLIQGDGAPYEREVRLRRKDGSYLWALVATSIVRATDGRPTHFVTVLSDISERKRAEEEVNRFRAAMDVTVDAIFLSNPQTMRLLYVNDTACRTLGYTREQVLQKPPWELLGR